MSFLLILILMAGVFAAGCGGEPDTSSPSGASVPPSSSDASLSNITEKGVLVIGCDDTFAPMEFRDIDGRVVGFDIDLANAVADYIGVELEVKAIDWRTKELELSNGNIDVIWNGY
ncbi:MAG: transporter substrate-binding domain-containing protein, partial [Clostridiales Family XIII bacterium]|nr:transporter substrate-binding domain-containing protein [Clostridiales Family XIII bacterium]